MQYNDQLTHEQCFDIIKMAGGAWVVYRPVGGIGDAVMILPALTALKEQIGDDLLVVICIDYIKSIFAHNPSIDIIFSFSEEDRDIGRHSECVKRLKDLDCVIYKLHDPCPGLVYESKNHPYIIKSRQQVFCEACDVQFGEDKYNLRVEENGHRKELGLGNRYIVIHPRSHDKWRDYPLPLVNALADKLAGLGRKNDFQVVNVDAIQELKSDNIINVIGNSLDKVMEIIDGAELLIGPDSMGVHLAGALDTKVLGLFGPTDASVRLKYSSANWMPKYEKCDRQPCWYQPCKFRFCLTTLKPRKVVQSVSELLQLSSVSFKKRTKKRKGKLAIVLLEGLGGTALLSGFAKKIYLKTGVRPVGIVRGYKDLFVDNPYVAGIQEVGNDEYDMVLRDALEWHQVVAEIKNGLGKWHNGIDVGIAQDFSRWSSLYDNAPIGVQVIEKYELNWPNVSSMMLGLPFDKAELECFRMDTPVFKLPDKYIVVTSGTDIWHKGVRQTKSWDIENWNKLVSMIKIPAIQVGTNFDELIEGAIDRIGQTTISELLFILRNAFAIVSIEGGLMHLAKMVNNDSTFILRGPTRGRIFSYPGQAYIDSMVCNACYYKVSSWHYECMENCDSVCMKTITPDRVFNTMERRLNVDLAESQRRGSFELDDRVEISMQRI